jgi:formylglycine-generating enzyme required for sulfatase activity
MKFAKNISRGFFVFCAVMLCAALFTVCDNFTERTITIRDCDRGTDDQGDTIINGIVYVFVEAGTFTMGSPADEAERYSDEIQHEVTLTKSFWISKYPITNRQFGRSASIADADLPVVNVSWQEAQIFAENRGGSLPTEAQWEFAARGGNIGKNSGYIYSGGNVLDPLGWYAGNSSGSGPLPVGMKQPNQIRLYDMSGNVYEWCYDWYRFNTTRGDAVDPAGPPSGTVRVVRSCSWESAPDECRVARRQGLDPERANAETGFRIVLE